MHENHTQWVMLFRNTSVQSLISVGLVTLSLFAISASAIAQNSILIPEISRTGQVQTINIRIISNNESIQALATKAFNSHGVFNASADGAPVYILKLDLDEENRVSYILQRNSPVSDVAKGSIKSNRWDVATLRICDIIVEKTTDLRGFFAGKLAFVGRRDGHREIYVSDLFFQKVDQLTRDQSYSLSPEWSPDALNILYTGYFRTGFPDIFKINILTGQRSMFATYKGSNTGAAYSTQGTEVAMVLSSSTSTEIYISDNEGRRPKRITNNRSSETSPSWSAKGDQLLITSDRLGSPQIFLLDRFSGNMERVNITLSRYCAEPAWNPVNPNILAVTVGVEGLFQIAIHDMSTGESQLVTQHSGDGVEPEWTNDGRHLIYTVRDGSTKRLQLIDTVTGKSTALHSARFGDASEASFVYPY